MLMSADLLLEATGMSHSMPSTRKVEYSWRPTTYRDYIIAICEELDLIDILRKKKPKAKLFTYESKPLKMKSRINYFLIANSMSHLVSHVNIGISIAPDHRAVRLNVNLTSNKRRPDQDGIEGLNNSVRKTQRPKVLENT